MYIVHNKQVSVINRHTEYTLKHSGHVQIHYSATGLLTICSFVESSQF